MKTRVIGLPSGRKVTLGEYVRSWRALKTVSPDKPIANWSHCDTRAGEILREIAFGVHDRINRHLPAYGRGRKWDSTWQADMMRTGRDVNTPRLAVHWMPVEFRARVGHRLSTFEA